MQRRLSRALRKLFSCWHVLRWLAVLDMSQGLLLAHPNHAHSVCQRLAIVSDKSDGRAISWEQKCAADGLMPANAQKGPSLEKQFGIFHRKVARSRSV